MQENNSFNNNADDGRIRIFLQTGDCFLAVKPSRVQTVLGSCVAVTLFCPDSHMGAICHAFLPASDESGRLGGREVQPCRFVDTALEHMFSGLTRLGVRMRDLQVKVFGGASGLGGNKCSLDHYNIGKRNVEAVLSRLDAWGLPIAKMDVGGTFGRKLIFVSDTGEVWLKRLGKLSSVAAEARRAVRNDKP